MEGILYALSDPVRVRIFADILRSDCPQTCSAFLSVDERSIPKSTLSLHFKVLREAGLIRSERHGVELHNQARCAEIGPRFKALVLAILEAYCMQAPAPVRRRTRKS